MINNCFKRQTQIDQSANRLRFFCGGFQSASDPQAEKCVVLGGPVSELGSCATYFSSRTWRVYFYCQACPKGCVD